MVQHLSQLGEFGLIEQIRKRFSNIPDGVTGIGDDCAILPQQFGRDTLVSTDMLIEGTHFLRRDISPYDLGWKSAAVNISDIAAMGGHPTATFLSLALPATTTCRRTRRPTPASRSSPSTAGTIARRRLPCWATVSATSRT